MALPNKDRTSTGVKKVSKPVPCWCGTSGGEDFSEHYLRCNACGTLYLKRPLPDDYAFVTEDEGGFYGQHYWTTHQSQELGLPEITTRSRADLPERDLYWLRTLLKYALPGKRVLEAGCGHGGFVALMRQAGFDAIGLEISPAIVSFAQETFGVPVLRGPLERLSLKPGEFDVIIAMDVLEHLTAPVAMMEVYSQALAPDGILLIQTPCLHDPSVTFQELVDRQDLFLQQLKDTQHCYLFNRESIRAFLCRLGFTEISFEKQLFEYDMFFVAGRRPLRMHVKEEIEDALMATPKGRIALALLDLDDRRLAEFAQWQVAEADRAARLESIHQLHELLRESDRVAAERLEALDRAGAALNQARGEAQRRVAELEQAAAERLEALEKADTSLREIRAEAQRRVEDVTELTGIIKTREKRIAELEQAAAERLEALEKADTSLREIGAEVQRRAEQIAELEQGAAERLKGLVEADTDIQRLHAEAAALRAREESLTQELVALREESLLEFLRRRFSQVRTKRRRS